MPHNYKMLIESLLVNLTADNYQYTIETAAAVQKIKGIGHVKMKSVKTAEEQQNAALNLFQMPLIKEAAV